jgi:hypothetical protein
VVNPACEGANGTCRGAGGIVTDKAAASAFFLVSDAHGGLCHCVEGGKRGIIWDDVMISVVECDVAGSKLFSATSFPFLMASVFSYP